MKPHPAVGRHNTLSIRNEIPAVAAICMLCFIFFWRMALTDLILPRGDAFTYFYPYWSYRNEILRLGQIPLWNPYLFMGVPFLANSQAGVFYPFNWPLIWLDAPSAVKVAVLFHSMVAAAGTYFFARASLNYNSAASVLAGIVFALGGYFTAQVEHVNQLQGLSWMPWAMLLWDLSLKSKQVRPIVWLGIVFSLQLLAGHTQSAFITVFGLFMLATWHALRSVQFPSRLAGVVQWVTKLAPNVVRHLAPIAVAGIVAIGLAAAQLLPTLELTNLSNRSGGLPFIEAISFSLRPTLLGKSLLPGYGESSLFTEYVGYLGVVALCLALLGGWAYRKDMAVGSLVFLALAGLFLAFGAYNPIYWLLVKVIPGFQLFRAPARWLVLFAFSAACLAGAGVNYLIRRKPDANRAKEFWPVTVILALALLSPLAALESREVIGATVPSVIDISVWIAAAGTAMFLLAASNTDDRLIRHAAVRLFLIASTIELFLASGSLPFNSLTAPSAWTSQRPAISAILAASQRELPPARFLSMSDILFDPGDLREIRAVYGSYLDERQLYDYIVATKQKDILVPNIPMYWHVPAVDGFDGGILPTRDYNKFAQLAVGNAEPSPDGRLRENLKSVPPLSWLRLTNTRWIITDKVYDAWIDSAYYDLQFSEVREQPVTENHTDEPIAGWLDYPFVATSIGVVGHLEQQGSENSPSKIGNLSVYTTDGLVESIPLEVDKIQSGGFRQVGGSPAKLAGYFDSEDASKAETQVLVTWDTPRSVDHVEIVLDPAWSGRVVIRGLTVVDYRDGSFSSMTMSPDHVLHLAQSGDVKIYEYNSVLPRAYLTCDVIQVASEDEMWEALTLYLITSRSIVIDSEYDLVNCADSAGAVQVTRYEPEHVSMEVQVTTKNSYLILSDSYYPGWEALVDGRATPILHANGLFRAVRVSEGIHTVEFNFVSKSFQMGVVTSVIFAIGAFTLLLIRWRNEP